MKTGRAPELPIAILMIALVWWVHRNHAHISVGDVLFLLTLVALGFLAGVKVASR